MLIIARGTTFTSLKKIMENMKYLELNPKEKALVEALS